MGAIHTMFKKTSSISRYAQGSGAQAKQEVLQSVATGVKCALRPITVLAQSYDQSNFGYEYRYYCDASTDIRVGDIVTVGIFNYKVRAVNFFEDEENGAENHKRATVVKQNNNANPTN